jgi:hypothetical protein
MSFILILVNWLYIITCKKCGYISSEKLPELKAKQMVRSHLGGTCESQSLNGTKHTMTEKIMEPYAFGYEWLYQLWL